MNESLAWLRDPATQPALSDLLCGLIRDIRLILVHPDLGNAAKLGAITQTVDQLAPPPGPQASAAPAAASVAALLARGTGPATALFEELAGEQVRIELTGRADRPLTAAECLELHTSRGAYGHQRTGTLRTVISGMVAAEVSSVVVPGRLPAATRWALGHPRPGRSGAAAQRHPAGNDARRPRRPQGTARRTHGARRHQHRGGVISPHVAGRRAGRTGQRTGNHGILRRCRIACQDRLAAGTIRA